MSAASFDSLMVTLEHIRVHESRRRDAFRELKSANLIFWVNVIGMTLFTFCFTGLMFFEAGTVLLMNESVIDSATYAFLLSLGGLSYTGIGLSASLSCASVAYGSQLYMQFTHVQADHRYEFAAALAQARDVWEEMCFISRRVSWAMQFGLSVAFDDEREMQGDYVELIAWLHEGNAQLACVPIGSQAMCRADLAGSLDRKTQRVQELVQRIRDRTVAMRKAYHSI